MLPALIPLRLLERAGKCLKMSNFGTVLRDLAELCEADACVLWEAIPNGRPERGFFALAEYPSAPLPAYYLPIDGLPRRAIDSKRSYTGDLDEAENSIENRALRKQGFRAFCACPIVLTPDRDVVVALYRRDRLFDEHELPQFTQFSEAIPHLFKLVRDAMGLQLLLDIENVFHEARPDEPSAIDRVLRLVTNAFGAAEASIYLEDATTGHFQRAPTARPPWPWQPQQEYRRTDLGLTAWTIVHGESLRFLDLSHLDDERQEKHKDIVWKNKERLEGWMQALVGEGNLLPPLSFMAVPIKTRGGTVGSIRCCAMQDGPHFFDNNYLDILKTVADQIGERWVAGENLRKEHDERILLEQFTSSIDALNALAFRELRKHGGPSLGLLFRSALEAFARLGPAGGNAYSIRLVGETAEKGLDLLTFGEPWNKVGQRREELRQRLGEDKSAYKAMANKRVVIDQQLGVPEHPTPPMFPKATRRLHAPILVDDESIGVLDLYGFTERPFPGTMETIAGLMAHQLGVYRQMFRQLGQLTEANASLQESHNKHLEIFDDFHHQISSPVYKAHYLVQLAAAARPADTSLRAIRGHTRWAEQVAKNLDHFIALAKSGLGRLDLVMLQPSQLGQKLAVFAADQEAVGERRRPIAFVVDIDSFNVLEAVMVRAHVELLEHAVMNLFDNASKYSFSNTKVTVKASLDQSGRQFRIGVINKGFHIAREDKRELIKRGVRSGEAELTAPGRGIGLYLVDEFMAAMGGALEIIPTDSRGLNEFRLALPCSVPKGI